MADGCWDDRWVSPSGFSWVIQCEGTVPYAWEKAAYTKIANRSDADGRAVKTLTVVLTWSVSVRTFLRLFKATYRGGLR